LGGEAGFIALDGSGSAHEVRVPCLTHSGRLWELGCGDWLELAACFALHHPVNAFGTPDIGNAEPGHARARPETIDLLLRSHEREKVVDAPLRREVRIVERIPRLLRNGGREQEKGKTEQVFLHGMTFVVDKPGEA
jgi:hypothetical protein